MALHIFGSRLKQENELMSYEILEKMKLLEKEKSEMFSLQLKKQMDWELEKKREIDHLRETHRFTGLCYILLWSSVIDLFCVLIY